MAATCQGAPALGVNACGAPRSPAPKNDPRWAFACRRCREKAMVRAALGNRKPHGAICRRAPKRCASCPAMLPMVRAANALYCYACRPSQGEPLRRDLCARCHLVAPVEAVGATEYCGPCAAWLRAPATYGSGHAMEVAA